MNGEAEPPNVADGELENVTLLENKLPSIDPLGTGLPNLSVENEINSSRLPPAAAVNAGVAVFGTKPPALPVKIVKSALAGTAAKLRTTKDDESERHERCFVQVGHGNLFLYG